MSVMTVASPCINVCRMDAANALCVGCWRTLDEIARWSRTSDDDRRAILAAVEQRRAGRATDPAPLRGSTDR